MSIQALETDGGALPVQVAGPLRVITADTDLERFERGSLALLGRSALVAGPFVLTDVRSLDSTTKGVPTFISLYVVSNGNCSVAPVVPLLVLQSGLKETIDNTKLYAHPQALSGLRLPVKQGETLCAEPTGLDSDLAWSGFRPY